jgi:hypothetical protein
MGGVLVQHHDPANRDVEYHALLNIAAAGPLDQRGDEPGMRGGNNTTAAHFGTVAFSSPKRASSQRRSADLPGWDSSHAGDTPVSTVAVLLLRLHNAVIHHRGGWVLSPPASLYFAAAAFCSYNGRDNNS